MHYDNSSLNTILCVIEILRGLHVLIHSLKIFAIVQYQYVMFLNTFILWIIIKDIFFQQFLDEENFKGEDYNLFQVAGQKCFEEGNIAEVLEIVQNEKNVVSEKYILFYVWLQTWKNRNYVCS